MNDLKCWLFTTKYMDYRCPGTRTIVGIKTIPQGTLTNYTKCRGNDCTCEMFDRMDQLVAGLEQVIEMVEAEAVEVAV